MLTSLFPFSVPNSWKGSKNWKLVSLDKFLDRFSDLAASNICCLALFLITAIKRYTTEDLLFPTSLKAIFLYLC